MDYRSLYLHFECAAVIYQSRTAIAIKHDFTESLKKCVKITLEDCRKRPLFKRIISGILRLFAPLM